MMEDKKQEWHKDWHLQIEDGNIFVRHLVHPRFITQIILDGSGQDDEQQVSWKMKWQDAKQGGLDWHFKALEFYNYAIQQAKSGSAE